VLVGLVEIDDDGNINAETIIPMIDGGTEGFKGQARIILPAVSAFFECTLELFPPRTTFQVCTLANTPRRPEHCIEYARLLRWGKDKPFVDEKGEVMKPDMDEVDHLRWIYEVAVKRAEEFDIKGVTMLSAKGVAKNIIPAIASTNAVVAACCSNEAFKVVTNASGYLNNYMMYMGSQGVYSHTFEYEKKDNCLTCSSVEQQFTREVNPDMVVQEFIDMLKADPALQLTNPSLRNQDTHKNIYLPTKQLEVALRPNLSKPLKDFLEDGNVLDITDPNIKGVAIFVKVVWKHKEKKEGEK